MDTAQLLFSIRAARNEDLLDRVQSYLAVLIHNGQIVGDDTPMAKVSGGGQPSTSAGEVRQLVATHHNPGFKSNRPFSF